MIKKNTGDSISDKSNNKKPFGKAITAIILAASIGTGAYFYIANRNSTSAPSVPAMSDVNSLQDASAYNVAQTDAAVKNYAGKYHKAKLSGNYISLEYSQSKNIENVTAADYQKASNTIKKRLDTLAVPYTFGTGGTELKTFNIKFSPENVTSDIVRMISNPPSVKIYNQYIPSNIAIKDFKVVKTDDNNLCFEVTFYDEEDKVAKDLRDISNQWSGPLSLPENMENIFLVVNDVTVSSALISDVSNASVLRFENLLCCNKEVIGPEDKNFAELVELIYNEDSKDMNMSLDKVNYSYFEGNKKTDLSYSEIPWKWNKHIPLESLEKACAENKAEVSVSVMNRSTIEVVMDIPLNAKFVTQYVNTLKKIYFGGGFDSGAYANVIFRAKAPKNAKASDESGCTFTKSYGKMLFNSPSFTGEVFGKYEAAMTKVFESDKFFTSRK